MTYYSRQIQLIGEEGQEKIQAGKVAIIGVGGLGCVVAEILTRAGIGKLLLIDGDVVELENIHRQSLFTIKDIGKPKVVIAKEKLQEINPDVNIEIKEVFANENNALDLLANCDIIVDCTDRITARYVINDASLLLGVPMIYGALFKNNFQLSVFNYNDGASYRCLFSEVPDEDSVPTCSSVGILPPVVYTAGSLQANEVIKILLEQEPLYNKLLVADLDKMVFNIFEIFPDEVEKNKVLTARKILTETPNLYCNKSEINYEEAVSLAQEGEAIVFDFRDASSAEKKLPNSIFVSAYEFSEKLSSIPKNKTLIFVCFNGVQSKLASEIAKKKGYKRSYYVRAK